MMRGWVGTPRSAWNSPPHKRSGEVNRKETQVFTDKLSDKIGTAMAPTAQKITALAITAIIISVIAVVIAAGAARHA